MTRFCLLALLPLPALMGAEQIVPKMHALFPLGARQGTSVEVEITGEYLTNTTAVNFDCRDLQWTKTIHASSGKLKGIVQVAADAPLGSHILHAAGIDGVSNSLLFNVGQFPPIVEREPNDRISEAQEIAQWPVEIQGRMPDLGDADLFAIRTQAGQRLVFDLRSMEYGSHLEAKLFLLDSSGNLVASNDDRNDFDETPWLEHTFAKAGTYYVKLDQYRGARGVACGKNCSYMLGISALPSIRYTTPLGGRIGTTARLRLFGTALERIERVYLTEARQGEYARMTYPHTVPIAFRDDPRTSREIPRIDGKVVHHTGEIEAQFPIPADARSGLWRLWGAGPQGISPGGLIELSDGDHLDETRAAELACCKNEFVIDGVLARPGEEDIFRIRVEAGRPLHFWTLAVQLGARHLDTVLQLRDASGKVLAENDDLVTGQGTVIGNPDSGLVYTPRENGELLLAVKDRSERGGADYQYRLKIRAEAAGFQLMTTPENLVVSRGGSSEIKVNLIREPGFEGEVRVWFEGLPEGMKAPEGRFQADQFFGPSADGDNIIIPEIVFLLHAPESLASGTYAFRVFGEDAAGRRVEAHTALAIGPVRNDVRRPLPRIAMTVCDPVNTRLSAPETLTLKQGEPAELELKAENLPQDAPVRLVDLPPGVRYKLSERKGERLLFTVEAAPEVAGTFEISAEAELPGRRISSQPLRFSVEAPAGGFSRAVR